MKALRVLTGIHAGAQIRLTSGTFRIGASEDADVCISDWRGDELALTVDESGVTHFCSTQGDDVLLADFVAVPVGDVVFCVGPDDSAWPRDLDLLAGLYKTAEPEPQGVAEVVRVPVQAVALRTMTWRTAALALGCTAAIGGLATLGVMFAGAQQSEAANVKVDVDALSTQVAQALHRAGLTELSAVRSGGKVAVRGMVSSASESAKVRRIIDSLTPGKAVREYDVAQLDVDNIQQSLAGTGAEVSYAGKGIFRVSGTVQSMPDFRERVAGVRADLDSNVKQLDVDVKEARMPMQDVEYTEVVATGGLRYIETPDGTKHLYQGGGAADQDNH